MTFIIQILLYLLSPMPAEGNITCLRFGYGPPTGPEEKIVGARWVDWGDGSQPGLYWLVKYDYKEPPMPYEVAKLYFSGKMDSTIRGWKIEQKELLSMSGDFAIYVAELIYTRHHESSMYAKQYRDTLRYYCCDPFEFKITDAGPVEE